MLIVVKLLGVDAGECQVACHGVLVHIDQAARGSGPSAFPEVIEEGQCLLVGQAGVLQDGAREWGPSQTDPIWPHSG